MLKLDADAQKQLLGGDGSGPLWAWLLGLGIALGALLAGAMAGVARWREWRTVPAAQRAWDKSLRLLARHGIALAPAECPSRLATRVTVSPPGLGRRAETADAGLYRLALRRRQHGRAGPRRQRRPPPE